MVLTHDIQLKKQLFRLVYTDCRPFSELMLTCTSQIIFGASQKKSPENNVYIHFSNPEITFTYQYIAYVCACLCACILACMRAIICAARACVCVYASLRAFVHVFSPHPGRKCHIPSLLRNGNMVFSARV